MIKFKEYIERFLNKPPNQQVKIILPYLITCIAISRVLELWRLCCGDIMKFCYNLDYLYSTIPNFCFNDVFLGSLLGIIIIGASRFHNKTHRKNMREGEEYGSSRWGTPDDIAPFIDSNPFNNIILSKTERLTMNPRMKKFSLNRNKHVIVYGGSGAGKTWTVVKSNLYQLHSNYVVTDPKGTLLPETGNLFYRKHFNIKVLDVIDFSNSMHYNPYHYIYEPKDTLSLANAILLN